MRTVEEHRAHLLAGVSPLPTVRVPVVASLGRVLAEDVVAAVDLPGFDNSAMDGYAVHAADLLGATAAAPVDLPVDGDIAAGDTRRHTLPRGRAMRIMTGAPMPAGADAVVPVEESDGGVSVVRLRLEPEVGRHVRPTGEDVRAGSVILRAGARMSPGRIALVAAANVPEVSVVRAPRVAVLSTGDELRPPGSVLEHGQIVDSNQLMLEALVRAAGGLVVGAGHLPDDAEAMRALLRDHPGEPDLLLTTGGVSMGAYDTVKEVLLAEGRVEFVKVAMRPGMPQGSGRVGPRRTPIITLPGNPVSSFVSFHLFVLPVLERLAGVEVSLDGAITGTFGAVAARGWSSAEGRLELTRVVEGPEGVRPSGGQGSHQLGALAEATALVVVPAGTDRIEAGRGVRCLPLVGDDRRRD